MFFSTTLIEQIIDMMKYIGHYYHLTQLYSKPNKTIFFSEILLDTFKNAHKN